MRKAEEIANPESCLNRARPDEMCFVLLGRDPASPTAIRTWCSMRVVLRKNRLDDEQIREALRTAESMEATQFAIKRMEDSTNSPVAIGERDVFDFVGRKMAIAFWGTVQSLQGFEENFRMAGESALEEFWFRATGKHADIAEKLAREPRRKEVATVETAQTSDPYAELETNVQSWASNSAAYRQQYMQEGAPISHAFHHGAEEAFKRVAAALIGAKSAGKG